MILRGAADARGSSYHCRGEGAGYSGCRFRIGCGTPGADRFEQLVTIEVEVNGHAERRWVYKPDVNGIYFTELSAIPRSGEQVTVKYRVPRQF